MKKRIIIPIALAFTLVYFQTADGAVFDGRTLLASVLMIYAYLQLVMAITPDNEQDQKQ